MREFLIKFLKKALGLLETPDPIEKRAKDLVIWAATAFDGKSGERKRAQVMSKLQHEFADARLRDLAFHVEKALQEIE